MIEHRPLSFQSGTSMDKAMPTIRSKGEALRGTSPPISLGFSRHDSGVPRHLELLRSFDKISSPGETESGSAGTQPDKGYPGRRCAHGTAGPWWKTLPGGTLLWRHGTPEPCLKKSIPEGKPGSTLTRRFSRRATFSLYLFSGQKKRRENYPPPFLKSAD